MINANTISTDDQGLWPCHVAALDAFVACDTQWRMRSNGMAPALVMGLDYAGVAVALEGFDLKLQPQQWKDFRVLEAAATHLLNGGKYDAAGEVAA